MTALPLPRLLARGLCLTLLLAALGCVKSAPTFYYMLDSGQPPPQTGMLPDKMLRLGAVGLPEYLDRRDMVLRHGQSSRLDVAGLHQWAEPLDKGVHRVLREVLTPRLAFGGYSLVSDSEAGENAPILLVDILRLDGDFNADSSLAARWQLRGHRGEMLAQGIFSAEQPTGPDFDALARSQSILVQRLGDYLANQLAAALHIRSPR